MTKYILHGGNIRGSTDEGKTFFEEIVKGLGQKPTILLCFFAQAEELWEKKYAEWHRRIINLVSSANPTLEMASGDTDTYIQQASHADALFVYGGSCALLLEKAKEIVGFIDSLSAIKVVAGSSAGAILLSRLHWCCDDRKVGSGLGMVPINCMVHYKSDAYTQNDPRGAIDWEKAEQELRQAVGPSEPITYLPEGQFIVIEQ